MGLFKRVLVVGLSMLSVFAPVMAQDAASPQDEIQDNMVVAAPADAGETAPGQSGDHPPTIPPEEHVNMYIPVKVVVTIDGKPAQDGVVTLIDKQDDTTRYVLDIENGFAKVILRKDHHFLVKFHFDDLKFVSDGAVWLGEKADSARIEIAYNTGNKRWTFNWKKFGDNERCSLYIDIKRANGKVPGDYHITLLDDRRVVLRDVWFGKDGRFTFILPKPEKGEKANRYFALLTSNHGPDFRYRFGVGAQSNRIRHELVIPVKKNPGAVEPQPAGTPATETKNVDDPTVKSGTRDNSGIE